MALQKTPNKKRCETRSGLFRIAILHSLIFFTLVTSSQIGYCDTAPDFTLTDIDGNPFYLSDFRGNIVVLNFFSSTCSACLYETNQLKTVQNEFGGELVIMSISWAHSRDTNEKLREFRDEYDVGWILAKDTENVTGKYDVPRIPTVFVIDQIGNKRYSHIDGATASVLIEEIGGLLVEIIDLNSDGKVDETDASIIASVFGSRIEEEEYEEKMDFNIDGTIDMRDIGKVAKYVEMN